MFNIFDNSEVHKNPLLAAEFIKIVPAFELVKHVLATTGNDRFDRILSKKAIKDGILNSDRDDLKLVLATYGDVLQLWDVKDFLKLYTKGNAYKAALFGNSKIDWYNLDEANKVEILHTTLLADFTDETNSELIRVLATNPRMDRKVVANAMLGRDGFEVIPITTRLQIGGYAISVEEIKADYWPGKDSPDTHEIYFSAVNEAYIRMLKDAKTGMEGVEFSKWLSHLLWQLPFADLDISSEHWLGPD